MANVEMDLSALDELAREIEKSKRVLLERLAERGLQLLSEKTQASSSGKRQSVRRPEFNYEKLQARLTVSVAEPAKLDAGNSENGKAKLRPKTGDEATKTGENRKKAALTPERNEAFLIPLSGQKRSTASNGKIAGQAAARLDKEIPQIADRVLREFFE